MRINVARASETGSEKGTSAGVRGRARQPSGPAMPHLVPSAELVVMQRMMQGSARREAAPAQERNTTGLPDSLKTGVETLSGVSLDDVKVHYNSGLPAQVQALAYTQGREIHMGPGQERNLPHEAWHVVQQKQGRVRATRQSKGMRFNDEPALEREADAMGERVRQRTRCIPQATTNVSNAGSTYHLEQAVQMVKLQELSASPPFEKIHLWDFLSEAPTLALEYAGEFLRKTARSAGAATQNQLTQFLNMKSKYVGLILSSIYKDHGSDAGPVRTAVSLIDDYYDYGLMLKYNFDDQAVRESFGSFLLSVATSGFKGKDTTGTLIGNTRSEWGGFFDHDKRWQKQ